MAISRGLWAFSLLLAIGAGLSSAPFLIAGAEPPAAAKPEPYAPGLGDFMTAYVQPHHIKLWLAGRQENWPLADYEAKELRETFEDVSAYQGVWHGFPIAKMVGSVLEPPLSAVDLAISNHNETAFAKAFDQLTAGCNACHQATQNAFLVIKTPAGSDFPDQQFQVR